MSSKSAGYLEHEHTADWELEVWAPTLPGLLEQAARGMYSLSGIRLTGSPKQERIIQVAAHDAEGLLIKFLQELLYIGEVEGIGFDAFEMQIAGMTLEAVLSGSPIDSIKKEIKAATYHNLKITSTDRGVVTRIVFDV